MIWVCLIKILIQNERESVELGLNQDFPRQCFIESKRCSWILEEKDFESLDNKALNRWLHCST